MFQFAWLILGLFAIAVLVAFTSAILHDIRDHRLRFQFSVKQLLVPASLCLLLLAAIFGARQLTSRIAISRTTFNRISQGMTKDEVIAVAGKPHEVNSIDENSWSYYIWNGFVPFSDPDYVFFGGVVSVGRKLPAFSVLVLSFFG